MIIFGTVYLYPENESEVPSVLEFMNSKFENVFREKNKHLVSERLNMSDEVKSEIEKHAKEKNTHVFISWISDDINKAGFMFYNFKTNLKAETDFDILSEDVYATDFLISCGAKKFIEREIF